MVKNSSDIDERIMAAVEHPHLNSVYISYKGSETDIFPSLAVTIDHLEQRSDGMYVTVNATMTHTSRFEKPDTMKRTRYDSGKVNTRAVLRHLRRIKEWFKRIQGIHTLYVEHFQTHYFSRSLVHTVRNENKADAFRQKKLGEKYGAIWHAKTVSSSLTQTNHSLRRANAFRQKKLGKKYSNAWIEKTVNTLRKEANERQAKRVRFTE